VASLPPGSVLRLAASVAAAAVLACGRGTSTPPGPPPLDPCALGTPGAPWLAFASRRTGDYEIWRARSDGTCFTQVTHDPSMDLYPSWSRTSIAFASDRSGALRIWLHDLATGAETPLATGDLASATGPAFSPDGTMVAFEGRTTGSPTSDIYVVPADGGTPVAVTSDPDDDGGPAWSPDGRTLYFVSLHTGQYDVWAVPAAGGAAVPVTTGSRIVGKPVVSPDGASIVFARTISGSAGTEVVRLDLGTNTTIVVSSQDDSEPALAPAGAAGPALAVRSFRAGHADVVLEALDGAGAMQLTNDDASDGAPAFAPLR
jgi:TolB protein